MSVDNHRVRLGDQFRITAHASVVTVMRARVLVEFDSGRLREYNVRLTSTADRLATQQPFGNIEEDGGVVRCVVARITPTGLKRGQCFVNLGVIDRNGAQVDQLAGDYLYDTNNLNLDRYENSLSGRGHLSWRTIADDIAPADITEPLAATNARRRVYGIVWYYNCSGDVANRTLQAVIQAPGLATPTGFSIVEVVSNLNDLLTLTSTQEGIIYTYSSGGGIGFSSVNDAGTVTVASNTTKARPLPVDVEENDLIEFRFEISNEEAADRHSVYIIQEEWITV